MGLTAHREIAIGAITALGHKHGLAVEVYSGNHGFRDYVEILRRSKAFISPLGIGEFSGILAGSLLVKPMASKLEAYPNIYDANITVSTAIDFSDLEEK
eukprot:CAMPEP_0177588624 /NCGR_PEP_ID=MMETSP0419_2-20121207/6329_1 /TAXON_ID=582737 /ORGANISM="Tetraselmis sp., Strain GSL018" /LENGTH=98 /DNA_ID=CAMNT_0019078843 /DNA_START=1669 /DNA_END=1962 /DNA_ORIENTATION=+